MTKEERSKLRIVFIEWEDSSSLPGWRQSEEEGPITMATVGVLVYENSKWVTISTSVSSAGNYLDQLTIPKSAILSRRKEIKWPS